jgi:hypothetical protein
LNVKFRIRVLLRSESPKDETVLPIGKESGPHTLILLQEKTRPEERYVAVAYEDVYGRKFESERNLRVDTTKERLIVGPLEIREI